MLWWRPRAGATARPLAAALGTDARYVAFVGSRRRQKC